MTDEGGLSFTMTYAPLFNETENNSNNSDTLINPTQAVLIAFRIGQVISILCIIFGILGNTALIFTISRSSFHRFPYGLLLLFIATFDIIRLISTAYYYLIRAYIIPLNLSILTIFIVSYRYPKNVTNWLKVFLAIERLIAVKYWVANRYNVNSVNATNIQRLRRRRILCLIFLLLLCSLISQHPNLIPNRFLSTNIDRARLLIIAAPNPKFYYGNSVYNGALFTIISYIILDDLLPVMALIILNTFLLYKLHHLPPITSKKLVDSIWILFFLTIFSIFVTPCSFIVLFNLYVDPKYVDDTIISVIFHTFQGPEMINHAITGYACFLSCRNLRKTFKEFVQTIYNKLRRKPELKNNSSPIDSIELPNISSKRE